MVRKILGVFVVCVLCFACLCAKKTGDQNKRLVRIGNRVLTQRDFDNFSQMMRFYPYELPKTFPGDRRQITVMTETDVICSSLPIGFNANTVAKSPDWQWKRRFFIAQMFTYNTISRNMGFSDPEIKQYYDAHRDTFKVTVKVGGDTALARDTTSTDTAKARTARAAYAKTRRDSIYYRPIDEVRDQMVMTLFGAKYPPDPAFVKKTFGDTAKPDSAAMKREWFFNVKRRNPDFFLNEYYRQYYGQKLPDSTKEWYGPGKLLTPKDMDVIMNWLPEGRRSLYKNPNGERELALWLLRWLIYTRKAEETGYARTREVAGVVEWAWKIQLAVEAVGKELLPAAKKLVKIDTAMCRYSYWDQADAIVIPPDSTGLTNEIQRQFDRETSVMLDSLIYSLRKKKGVLYLQTDQKDDKDQNPAILLARGDSLRDTGNADGADGYYQRLVTDFSFMPEGRKAWVEVAKIQMDRQLYREAIDNYRRFLIAGHDKSRSCNNFFMIGFIYDEHLNKPQIAEMNYNWIMKNEPSCELADDAEFMCMHLDEPLTRIEELRGEALRQGRIVEPDADTTAVDTSAAAKAGQKNTPKKKT